MISRIETINDLEIWLECLRMLHKKNASFPELLPEQSDVLSMAQDILEEIRLVHTGTFKQCCKCMCIWPETKEWFDWNGQGRTGLHADCKFCRNTYQKTRKKQKNHPSQSESKARPASYGLTFEQAKRTQEAGKDTT